MIFGVCNDEVRKKLLDAYSIEEFLYSRIS